LQNADLVSVPESALPPTSKSAVRNAKSVWSGREAGSSLFQLHDLHSQRSGRLSHAPIRKDEG
jgi:hypothetical protein